MNGLLVINDANILIDFCKLRLLDALFQLAYNFCTVDAVWEELRTDQQDEYTPYIISGKFKIEEMEVSEMEEVITVRISRPQLSLPDCTALVYAKIHKGVLLSSDKNLRSTAIKNKVMVKGHLWIFDELFQMKVMGGDELVSKLDELCKVVNPRLHLPEAECKERKKVWREGDEKHKKDINE